MHNFMDTGRFIESINKKRESAWQEMYRKYYPAMCNCASKIVKDDISAEDIVQDCFIKIWDSGTQFPDVPSLVGYLYRTIYTRALNSIRDKGIAQALYEKWGDAVLDGQDDEVILELAVEEDVVNKFYEAIDKLSEQQRQVLFMSMEGAKVKDIAEQLGISENSVKTQKKRAYAFVRNELGESLAMLIFILFS